jgi:hypothetical protein
VVDRVADAHQPEHRNEQPIRLRKRGDDKARHAAQQARDQDQPRIAAIDQKTRRRLQHGGNHHEDRDG